MSATREELIQRHRHLVRATRARILPTVPPGLDEADLESEGLIALCQAADSFEEARGAKFQTYAIAKIRGAILEHLRKEDWVPRSVREKEKRGEAVTVIRQVSLESLVTDEDGEREEWLPDPTPAPAETVPHQVEVDAVRWALSCLPRRARAVMQARYEENRTQAEVARQMGVSGSLVAQIEAVSRRRVAAFLRHLGGQDWGQ